MSALLVDDVRSTKPRLVNGGVPTKRLLRLMQDDAARGSRTWDETTGRFEDPLGMQDWHDPSSFLTSSKAEERLALDCMRLAN